MCDWYVAALGLGTSCRVKELSREAGSYNDLPEIQPPLTFHGLTITDFGSVNYLLSKVQSMYEADLFDAVNLIELKMVVRALISGLHSLPSFC